MSISGRIAGFEYGGAGSAVTVTFSTLLSGGTSSTPSGLLVAICA